MEDFVPKNVRGINAGLTDTGTGSVASTTVAPLTDDYIGINANRIPEMKIAIREYIYEVNAHLEEMDTRYKTENAMKGGYADAVQRYVQEASIACRKLVSNLLMFNDNLTIIENNFKARDVALSENIETEQKTMASKWQEYKEKNA